MLPLHGVETILKDAARAAQISRLLAGTAGGIMGGGAAAVPKPVSTTFIGQEAGPAIAIPEGAVGPTLTRNGLGVQYTGGGGGNGLAPSVNNVRIMGPTSRYANGYANYGKTMADGSWQAVYPYTGQSLGKASSWWHIELK